MSNVKYLHYWNPDLCIRLQTDFNMTADFNRFLIKHFPSTQTLQKGGEFKDADREIFVLQLKSRFDEAIEEGRSHRALYNLFNSTSQYLRWCDKEDIKAFTQLSVESYMDYQNKRVMLGQIQNSTYVQIHSKMLTVFNQELDLPRSFFANIVVRDKSLLQH